MFSNCIIRDLSWCTCFFSLEHSFGTAVWISSIHREFMIVHVLTTMAQQVVDRKIQHKYKNDINLSHGVCTFLTLYTSIKVLHSNKKNRSYLYWYTCITFELAVALRRNWLISRNTKKDVLYISTYIILK